jgi:hypothetical protein
VTSRQQIMQRASDEYSRAVAHCEANRAEVLRQERAALSSLPAMKDALDAHDAALAAAEQQYQETLATSEETLATAESDAVTAQTDLETEAIQGRQQATDDIDIARRDAIDSAQQEYDRAYHEATTRLVGPDRDARLSEARSARDEAMTTAEREYARARQLAQSTHQKSMNDAREGAITAIEKARREQQRVAEAAALERDRARDKAETAWGDALAAAPLAASIREAFRLRMQQVEVDCEREKAEVIQRMQRDLSAPHP